ncbi:unnamed protein product [Fraxinus pennsylvanica]|uniref:Uncharacterized protein n=1 Tax=Fraxinus pennsylvanica TaxID=56036 RepID=A0AAD1ZRM2_9LAMI|nr:unnamed protein product [Fraxinus pennsylvanica]
MLEKLPQEQHSVGSVSARIGWLLLLTSKVEEAIPYLEDAAERLKESFGSKHFGVGYVYNNLGAPSSSCGFNRSVSEPFKSICCRGKVVEAWEGHGPSAQDDLKEAIRALEQLKSKARGSSTESVTKALPLPRDSEGISGRNLKSRVSIMESRILFVVYSTSHMMTFIGYIIQFVADDISGPTTDGRACIDPRSF